MNFRDAYLCDEAGTARVRLDAAEPARVASLLLGSASAHAWADLVRWGAVRFAAETHVETNQREPLTRDFGDSILHGTSGGESIAQVLTQHRATRPGTPAAFAFAFAQQWARLGFACVHGALLRVENTGVLVLGARAAGKSVLAASAIAAGGALVSDDYLLVGRGGEGYCGERIRQFVSLRRSWAADSLRASLGDGWCVSGTGNRAFLRVPDDDPRFPASVPIHRIWIASRPGAGRAPHSSLREIDQAQAYAALVTAIQPLLLGAGFPHERGRLQTLLGGLLASVPAARIEAGQDIVTAPKETWSGLLSA